MPTPYLVNVNFDVTSSVSVQNRRDQSNNIATYVLLKPGVTSDQQFMFGNTENAQVCFAVPRTFIPQLTASLWTAFLNPSTTGSW